MSVIVGIDPGVTGAVAVVDSHTWGRITVDDLVAIPYMSKGFVKRRIDGWALYDYLESACGGAGGVRRIVIERVHAGSTQGVSSNFSLGLSLGTILGVCSSGDFRGVEKVLVRPQDWKNYYGLEAAKKDALECARAIWPDKLLSLKRAKDHNRAEAMLIAYYGCTL